MTGYLHRVRLNSGLSLDQLARAIPANAYAEHKLVWRWFADDSASRDFLFRREQHGERPTFYVLSRRPAADPTSLWDIESKPFEPRLALGTRLAFTLRANPVRVRKVSDDQTVKSRRRDDVVADLKKRHYPDCAQRPPMAELVQKAGSVWLEERAESAGFTLESVIVDNYQQQRWYKAGMAQPITLSTVEYTGKLVVRDPNLFIDKLFRGIGPAKSFGCGLLLVRRVV